MPSRSSKNAAWRGIALSTVVLIAIAVNFVSVQPRAAIAIRVIPVAIAICFAAILGFVLGRIGWRLNHAA